MSSGCHLIRQTTVVTCKRGLQGKHTWPRPTHYCPSLTNPAAIRLLSNKSDRRAGQFVTVVYVQCAQWKETGDKPEEDSRRKDQVQKQGLNPDRLPPMSTQPLHSHPASHRYMLLRKPSDESQRARALHEPPVGQNQHTLLAPREHDVGPPPVCQEPWRIRSNDGEYDMIFFVSLEGVDP